MSVISMFANGEIVALDATLSVGYSKGAQISTSTIFKGASISDNYRPDKPTLNVSGVVTATKTRSNEEGVKTPSEFRGMIDNWIDNQYLISIYGTFDGAIPNLSNIAISNYNVVRDGQRADGLMVSFSLQQLDISTSVSKTSVTVPKSSTKGLTSEPSTNTVEGKTTDITTKIPTSQSGRDKYGSDTVDYVREDGQVIPNGLP